MSGMSSEPCDHGLSANDDRPEMATTVTEPVAQGPTGRDAAASVQAARFVALGDEPGLGVGGGGGASAAGPGGLLGAQAAQSIELLRDVEVDLTVELGSARMLIKHILGLRPGSVVELNRLAGEPVDIMINKTLIARGEVVVVDEKFAIRVVEIVPPERRLGG